MLPIPRHDFLDSAIPDRFIDTPDSAESRLHAYIICEFANSFGHLNFAINNWTIQTVLARTSCVTVPFKFHINLSSTFVHMYCCWLMGTCCCFLLGSPPAKDLQSFLLGWKFALRPANLADFSSAAAPFAGRNILRKSSNQTGHNLGYNTIQLQLCQKWTSGTRLYGFFHQSLTYNINCLRKRYDKAKTLTKAQLKNQFRQNVFLPVNLIFQIVN